MKKPRLLVPRRAVLAATASVMLAPKPLFAAFPSIAAEPQPFFAMLRRVVAAFDGLGEPLPPRLVSRIESLARAGTADAVAAAQALLAPRILVDIALGLDGYGVPTAGALAPELIEQGWRSFLVRVVNPHGVAGVLSLTFDQPNLGDVEANSRPNNAHQRQSLPTPSLAVDEVHRSILAIEMIERPPMEHLLSGLSLEYRIASIAAFRAGRLETGVMTAALATAQYAWVPSAKARLAFVAASTRDVPFRIRDDDGSPTIAGLVVSDGVGRLYPSKAGRLEPDMFFQDQVYRADGESLRLPAGRYRAVATRGPEYRPAVANFAVPGPAPEFHMTRWIDPAASGWYSGDVHVHASGCAHYSDPSVGVGPATMGRHARGEGLWIAEVLTWGPGWEVQGRNFTGRAVEPPLALDQPALQAAHATAIEPRAVPAPGLLRYDVEVSGFPSSYAGHLVLLRLKEQNYPGASDPRDWPSWCLPILQWAKAQGAVTGFAHSGLGNDDLEGPIPSLSVPSFDSIGANEYLVDVAHDAVDFLSGGDSMPRAELTQWYHALNCGFRTVLAGETDWPCITDQRVGAGRTYVQLDAPPREDRGYQAWAAGLKAGHAYMGDGRSHCFEFAVDGVGIGGEVHRGGPTTVEAGGTIMAWLDPVPPPELAGLRDRPDFIKPMWHVERARLPGTRTLQAELIVNGQVAATQTIVADGTPQRFARRLAFDRCAWIALRILPSLHTNPVFVIVDGAPVRAVRSSAEWCLKSLAKIEARQLPQIREEERAAARAAYEHARQRFATLRDECLT